MRAGSWRWCWCWSLRPQLDWQDQSNSFCNVFDSFSKGFFSLPLLDVGWELPWSLLAQVWSKPCEYFFLLPVFLVFLEADLVSSYETKHPNQTKHWNQNKSWELPLFHVWYDWIFWKDKTLTSVHQTSGPGLISGPKYCGEQTTQVALQFSSLDKSIIVILAILPKHIFRLPATLSTFACSLIICISHILHQSELWRRYEHSNNLVFIWLGLLDICLCQVWLECIGAEPLEGGKHVQGGHKKNLKIYAFSFKFCEQICHKDGRFLLWYSFWLKAIRASNPDLIGAQEVGDYAFEVIAHIGSDYKVRQLPNTKSRILLSHKYGPKLRLTELMKSDLDFCPYWWYIQKLKVISMIVGCRRDISRACNIVQVVDFFIDNTALADCTMRRFIYISALHHIWIFNTYAI